jgi:hypothetical protein
MVKRLAWAREMPLAMVIVRQQGRGRQLAWGRVKQQGRWRERGRQHLQAVGSNGAGTTAGGAGGVWQRR